MGRPRDATARRNRPTMGRGVDWLGGNTQDAPMPRFPGVLFLMCALASACDRQEAPGIAAGSGAPAPVATSTPTPTAEAGGSAGAVAPGTAAPVAAEPAPVAADSAAVEPGAADPAGAPAGPVANSEVTAGENLLSLASGAYLVRQPDNDRAFDHNPINLIFDGMMWRSPEGTVTNQVFVIETPAVTTLTSIGFDTNHLFHTPEENARNLVVEASNESSEAGFQPILATALAADAGITAFPVTAKVPGRWFRLTIADNHGATAAMSLKRIFGYGSQEPAAMPANLTGTYRFVDSTTGAVEADNRNDIFLKQDASTMVGCWRATGTLAGGLAGTVGTIQWKHPDLGTNGGLMVFTALDRVVFWRLNDSTFWAFDTFQRVSPDIEACGDGSTLGGADELAKDLADTGRAVVYGINFDFNSDKLRAESKVVLDRIVKILEEHPDWKMAIEGHTDDIGGAPYNQALSERRARAVVTYLTQAKVSADRLTSTGVGLASPIAANDTDIGRARNRRVELVKR